MHIVSCIVSSLLLDNCFLSVAQSLESFAASLLSSTSIDPAKPRQIDTAMAQEGIFSANLLSPEVKAALPAGYTLRALRKSDFDSGFLDCLRVLTTVGEISEADFAKQYDEMAAAGSYYIIIIEDTSRAERPVVGTGALIVERKL